MNPLQKMRTIPLSGSVLRVVGWLFLIGGAVGAQMQAHLVNQAVAEDAVLLEMLEANPSMMTTATYAMMLSLLEYLAVPIFTFLLVEGALHTKRYGKYLLRILGLAFLCQLPYQLNHAGLNSVFGLVLALIQLYFFRRFTGKGVGSIVIRVIAVVGCLLWSMMLPIDHAPACVVISAALWLLKDKPYFRTFGGFAVTMLCSVFSPGYAAASLSFLILHFYSGKRGKISGTVSYLFYPMLLLLATAAQLL